MSNTCKLCNLKYIVDDNEMRTKHRVESIIIEALDSLEKHHPFINIEDIKTNVVGGRREVKIIIS